MPVVDNFKGSNVRDMPLTGGLAVDLSSADYVPSEVTRAVWVGTAGDLKVDMPGVTGTVIPNIGAGWHPIRVTKIYKIGTAADDIWAGW